MGGSGAARAWKCGALERARAWNWGSPELTCKGRVWLALWPAVTPGRWPNAGRSKPAVGGDGTAWKFRKFWKMVSGAAKTLKKIGSGDAPERSISFLIVICENDMLWSENLGLKMGVSKMAHTQYAHKLYGRGGGGLCLVPFDSNRPVAYKSRWNRRRFSMSNFMQMRFAIQLRLDAIRHVVASYRIASQSNSVGARRASEDTPHHAIRFRRDHKVRMWSK